MASDLSKLYPPGTTNTPSTPPSNLGAIQAAAVGAGPTMGPGDPGFRAEYAPPPAPGITREQVVAIQQALIAAGYNLGRTGADGEWGPKTQAAYDEFQRRRAAGAPQPAAAAPAGGGAPAPAPVAAPAPAAGPGPAPAPTPTGPRPAMTAQSPDEIIRQQFGAMAWMLNIPELSTILHTAAGEGWTADILNAAIQNSNWWKTHTQAQIDNEILRDTRPADYQAKLDATIRQIMTSGAKAGIAISPQRAQQIAEHGLSAGFTDADFQSAVADEFHWQPVLTDPTTGRAAFTGPHGEAGGSVTEGNAPPGASVWTMPDGRQAWYFPGQNISQGNVAALRTGVGPVTFHGQAASTAADMRKTAAAYGVPLTDAAIGGWLDAELHGRSTPDDFMAEIQRQASGRYPWWSKQIAAGQTPFQLATPYMQLVSQVYGRDPAAVTLDDPDVKAGIGQIDPATGQPVPMGLWAFEQHLKRDGSPYWTDPGNLDARNTAATMATELGVRMGLVAR